MTHAAITRGGERLARAVLDKTASKTTIEVWNLGRPERIWSEEAGESIPGFAASQDGSRLGWTERSASRRDSSWLRIVDLESFNSSPPVPLPTTPRREPWSMMAFDARGLRLVVATRAQGTIMVFDLGTRRNMHRIETPAKPIGITLSLDGEYIAVASRDKYVRVYATDTGQVQATMTFDSSTWNAELRFDPKNRYLFGSFLNTNPNLPSIWRWLWDEENLARAVVDRLQEPSRKE
jgi:WD40 repeat protein